MRPRTPHNFNVVDLGVQVGGVRRFAVWDAAVERFWKINNHQTWQFVDELLDDFVITFPGEKFAEVHQAQRDRLAMLATGLGFDRDA